MHLHTAMDLNRSMLTRSTHEIECATITDGRHRFAFCPRHVWIDHVLTPDHNTQSPKAVLERLQG